MMDAYELFGDELDYLDRSDKRPHDWDSRGYEDEEPEKCELDSDNGGVCLKRLVNGKCPVHGEGYCGRELGVTNAYCTEKLHNGTCANEDKHWDSEKNDADGSCPTHGSGEEE